MPIDEDLQSRQLAVYGREAMATFATADIVVCGINGLGVEVAKNVILAAVRSVTIQDGGAVSAADLGSNFYLTEADIGRNRAEACRDMLADLNSAVKVTAVAAPVDAALLAANKVAVFCDSPLAELTAHNASCRQSGTKFIMASCMGLVGSTFVDLGDAFTVGDTDGEQPFSSIIASIMPNEEHGSLVTSVEDERLELEDGHVVQFSEVKGMDGINGKEFTVSQVSKKHNTWSIGDISEFGQYVSGGIAIQKKQPKVLEFKPLAESVAAPGNLIVTDFAKFERPPVLHLLWRAIEQLRAAKGGAFPGAADAAEYEAATAALNTEKLEIDAKVASEFLRCCDCVISPMAAVFGGIVGQEVLKAVTGKFHPIGPDAMLGCGQWFYFDALEAAPAEPPADAVRSESRYLAQEAIWGKGFQEKMGAQKVFLVGAGALGCEFAKGFAMMGMCCGEGGLMTVTDDDIIEKSNLSRQFLFRDSDVKALKSACLGKAAQAMNPALKLNVLDQRVGPATEDVFDATFWNSLDFVTNALDNVKARLYVDSQCLYYQKALLESGTLGPKCNTQMVLPFKTENYGASQDPPEKEAPMCTLHSFPHNIQHTLAWARSEFEGEFDTNPSEAQNYLTDSDYLTNLRKISAGAVRQKMEDLQSTLVAQRPKDFRDCITYARLYFEEKFANKIKQLAHTFPEDATTSSGTPFWSPPKRFPRPLAFDADDAMHMDFVIAGANLRASTFGTAKPAEHRDASFFKSELATIAVPTFSPKDGVRIKVKDDEEDEAPVLSGPDEDDRAVEAIVQAIGEPGQGLVVGGAIELSPEKFEKDDDTNFHMDFITACSNARARNYSIEEADLLKSKLIAGKIIPAIATTTAMATGLVCLEMFKLLQDKDVDAFKNAFCNLAVPFFTFSEPLPPKKTKYQDKEWSAWDRWVMKDQTVQEMIDFFEEEHQLEVNSILCGSSCLYMTWNPKHRARCGQLISELATQVAKKDFSGSTTFDVIVGTDDEEGEAVDLPTITLTLG